MPSISPSEFSRLFTENKDRLVALADSYVHDRHAAEDIVADAFTRFWDQGGVPSSPFHSRVSRNAQDALARSLQPAKVYTAPRMYLYAMVRNRCLNYLRDRAARQKILDARLRSDIEALEDGMSGAFMSGDLEREISRFLDNLPHDRREIFCASRFDGLSHNEIALRYGYTPRKIRREIGRVLTDLRELLVSLGR